MFAIELLAALLTPVISVVTTIILINQYRMEKKRWRLDLFEKRYAVYRATLEFISSIMRQGKCTPESQSQFLLGTRDRGLFFKDEIETILNEVWNAGIDLETHQEIYKDLAVGDERTKHIHAAADIKKSMPELGRKAQDLFGNYLNLHE